MRLHRGRLPRTSIRGRTRRLLRLYRHCKIGLVLSSSIRLTTGINTSKIRVKRSSVRLTRTHRVLKPSGVVNIATGAIRRTGTTRTKNTSCLKDNTIFNSAAGGSTVPVGRRLLRRVYRDIGVPIITVKKVATRGILRLGNENVTNITIIDNVFTYRSVRANAQRLKRLMRRVVWEGRGEDGGMG